VDEQRSVVVAIIALLFVGRVAKAGQDGRRLSRVKGVLRRFRVYMSLKRILAALVIVLALESVPSGAEPGRPVREPRRPVRSLLEQRHERVVIQAWDLSCGAAALATVLKYQHDDPVSEREVALAMIGREEYIANPGLVRYRHGFSLLDLKRYVDERGYEGVGYGKLLIEDLIERAPVMVPVRFRGYNHFVVFRGAMGDSVLLADPAFGNRSMSIEKFEAAWLDYAEFGRVGFVVARRDGAEPPNRLTPLPSDFVILRSNPQQAPSD
jgi:hypothetical protein